MTRICVVRHNTVCHLDGTPLHPGRLQHVSRHFIWARVHIDNSDSFWWMSDGSTSPISLTSAVYCSPCDWRQRCTKVTLVIFRHGSSVLGAALPNILGQSSVLELLRLRGRVFDFTIPLYLTSLDYIYSHPRYRRPTTSLSLIRPILKATSR